MGNITLTDACSSLNYDSNDAQPVKFDPEDFSEDYRHFLPEIEDTYYRRVIKPTYRRVAQPFDFNDVQKTPIEPVMIDGQVLTQEEKNMWSEICIELFVLLEMIFAGNPDLAQKIPDVFVMYQKIETNYNKRDVSLTENEMYFLDHSLKEMKGLFIDTEKYPYYMYVLQELSYARCHGLPLVIPNIPQDYLAANMHDLRGDPEYEAFISGLDLGIDLTSLSGKPIDWIGAGPDKPTLIVSLDAHNDFYMQQGIYNDWRRMPSSRVKLFGRESTIDDESQDYGKYTTELSEQMVANIIKQHEIIGLKKNSTATRFEILRLYLAMDDLARIESVSAELVSDFSDLSAATQELHEEQNSYDAWTEFVSSCHSAASKADKYEAMRYFQYVSDSHETLSMANWCFEGGLEFVGYEGPYAEIIKDEAAATEDRVLREIVDTVGSMMLRSEIAYDNFVSLMADREEQIGAAQIGAAHYPSMRSWAADERKVNVIFVQAMPLLPTDGI
jgi:hypothetical protein